MDDNFGYRLDLENREELIEQSPPFALMAGTFAEPERVDPRPILVTEDQGSMGACQGHALSTCVEWCYYVASGGKYLQLSRLFAYLGTQKLDGISGDHGSTISGGSKLARNYGLCTEQTLPYPSPVRYPGGGYHAIPEAAWEQAQQYKISTAQFIKEEPEVKQWLAAGAGLVEIGIGWGNGMTPNSKGIISSYRPGSGGHAVVIGGYVPESAVGVSNPDGFYYLLHNSWSKRWGMAGWAYVTPSAVRQMLHSNSTTFVGLSDMQNVKPRTIDFTKESVIG